MTMPDPPGHQVIAPGQVIASDWGNEVWNQSVQRFADNTALNNWTDPPDGALVFIESVQQHWMRRYGAWLPMGPFDVQAAEIVAQMNAGGGAVFTYARPFGVKPVTMLMSADLQAFAGYFSLYGPGCTATEVAFNAYSTTGALVPGALVRTQILAVGNWATGALTREGGEDGAVTLHPYPAVTGPNGEAWTVDEADAYMAQYNAERADD